MDPIGSDGGSERFVGSQGFGRLADRGGASRSQRQRASRRTRKEMSWDAPTLFSGWGKGLVTLLVVVLLAGVYVVVQEVRAVPRPSLRVAVRSQLVIPGTPVSLPWPVGAEAEVAVAGVGTFGPNGASTAVPIGSVAKIMTAYIILKDHPLAVGAQGPTIPVTAADVAIYQSDLAQGDSVVPVTAGQGLTELQALQALLIPSGDNIAVLLAEWDSQNHTEAAFVAKMNAMAASLGLSHTTYADPSGLSDLTKSTPGDQLILAPLAMAIPTFAATVNQSQVDLPTAGVFSNYNTLLGIDGVIGIKTGSVSTGDLVFAADHSVGGRPVTIYGAVLGVTPTATQTGLIAAAVSDSKSLLTAVESDVTPVTVVPAGSVQADVGAPWLTSSVPVATAGALTVLGWPGLPVKLSVTPSGPLARGLARNTVVGRVTATVGTQTVSTELRTTAALPKPSFGWRLTRF